MENKVAYIVKAPLLRREREKAKKNGWYLNKIMTMGIKDVMIIKTVTGCAC